MRPLNPLGTLLSLGLLSLSTQAADIDPIVIKGSKFFYKNNGNQFFMRGIAYQQEFGPNGSTSGSNKRYLDPLADANACRRDIPYLKQLRTNTIRVYAVDPQANHDECMKMLADAGIYVVADLSQPDQSLNRDAPSWTYSLLERYTSVIDALAKYENTLGFFAGNEVSNQPNNTDASAFVKAAVRDSKAYIREKNLRPIGVGYATNDDQEIRQNLARYFNCGDPKDSIDFWGYNIYSWCGLSSFTKSGYDKRTEEFSSYSVPVFFAEYGCNEVRPRPFTEVQALYGPQMTPVWSGGIVYMYFQEANNYGLVTVTGNKVQTNADFDTLAAQLKNVNPAGVNIKSYNPASLRAAECPAISQSWAAKSDPLPPPASKQLCQCMQESLSCVVSENLNPEEYGKFFGSVCGLNGGEACRGIARNATLGQYGVYSMCEPKEQLSFVFNKYASSQKNSPEACKFNGAAVTRQASNPSKQCKEMVSRAGNNGQGTVTPSSSSSKTGSAEVRTGASNALSPSVVLSVLTAGLVALPL